MKLRDRLEMLYYSYRIDYADAQRRLGMIQKELEFEKDIGLPPLRADELREQTDVWETKIELYKELTESLAHILGEE